MVDLVKGQEELSLSGEKSLQLPQILFVANIVVPTENLAPCFLEEIDSKAQYAPPLITRDFQILHEVFLI